MAKRRRRYAKADGQGQFCVDVKHHGTFCGTPAAIKRCELSTKARLITGRTDVYDGYAEMPRSQDRQYWSSFPKAVLAIMCADSNTGEWLTKKERRREARKYRRRVR